MSSKLFSAITSLLIGVLIFSGLAPAVYAEPAQGVDSDVDIVISDTASMTDVYYYSGIAGGSSIAGILAGALSGKAVAGYIQAAMTERAIATADASTASALSLSEFLTGCVYKSAATAGYESLEAYSAAGGVAGVGGLATGILIGLTVAGLIFLVGYYCYQ